MGLPSEVGGKAKYMCSWEPSEEDFQGGVISCVKYGYKVILMRIEDCHSEMSGGRAHC